MRGPAMDPSLVTWPTMMTGSPRSFATRMRVEATSRTWLGCPAIPSESDDDTVCTESTISSSGRTSSTCPRIVARSVSAAMNSSSCRAPVRSARRRTWAVDSSALA